MSPLPVVKPMAAAQPKERASWTVLLCVVACMFCSAGIGLSLGFTSPAFNTGEATGDLLKKDKLDVEMAMSSQQMTWFGSIVNLGAGFGAVLGGYPVARFGKRAGMVTSNLLYAVGWAMQLSVSTVEPGESNEDQMVILLVARFILGLAVGGVCSTTATYLTEVSVLKHRGTIGTLFQVGVTVGYFFLYLLGLYLNWRQLCIMCLCVSGVAVVLCCLVPESPSWLLTKGRVDDARHALFRLKTADSDFEGLEREMWKAKGNEEGFKPIACVTMPNTTLEEVKTAPEVSVVAMDEGGLTVPAAKLFGVSPAQPIPEGTVVAPSAEAPCPVAVAVALVTPAPPPAVPPAPRSVTIKALLMGVGLMITQQLSGINAVMAYASYILGIAVPDIDEANRYTVGVQALQLVVTACSAFLIERFGRKPMMLASCGGLVASIALMNVYFFDDSNPPALVIIALHTYVAAFSLGMGPVPWFIMGELFHPDVRSACTSFATAVNWSLCFGVTKTVHDLQATFGGGDVGMGWVFSAYGTSCTLGALFILFCIPETKGKPYAVIEAELRGGKRDPPADAAPGSANPLASVVCA